MTTSTLTKICVKCASERSVEEYAPDPNEPDGRNTWCDKCRSELGKELSEYRRQSVTNRVAQKTSIGEDLLTVLHSPVGPTVERFLDALAGLVESTAAGKSTNPNSIRTRTQHAPLPSFNPAWATRIATMTEEQLWELSETLHSYLNRPEDPAARAGCDRCGNRRIGDAAYCQTCGTRIAPGSKRCRFTGCTNEGKRRSLCPAWMPTPTGLMPHP